MSELNAALVTACVGLAAAVIAKLRCFWRTRADGRVDYAVGFTEHRLLDEESREEA